MAHKKKIKKDSSFKACGELYLEHLKKDKKMPQYQISTS